VGKQRINKTTLAYIAGFLDGDGSILLQFKPSKRHKFGFVVYPSVRFYQDSNNEEILYWIKDQIGYGYMHKRKDKRRNTAMSQYSIEGANQVKKILIQLRPFIQFKKKQTKIVLRVIEILQDNGVSKESLLEISKLYDEFALCSYISHRRKYTGETIRRVIAKIDS
jgi:hypothetical protein